MWHYISSPISLQIAHRFVICRKKLCRRRMMLCCCKQFHFGLPTLLRHRVRSLCTVGIDHTRRDSLRRKSSLMLRCLMAVNNCSAWILQLQLEYVSSSSQVAWNKVFMRWVCALPFVMKVVFRPVGAGIGDQVGHARVTIIVDVALAVDVIRFSVTVYSQLEKHFFCLACCID